MRTWLSHATFPFASPDHCFTTVISRSLFEVILSGHIICLCKHYSKLSFVGHYNCFISYFLLSLNFTIACLLKKLLSFLFVYFANSTIISTNISILYFINFIMSGLTLTYCLFTPFETSLPENFILLQPGLV